MLPGVTALNNVPAPKRLTTSPALIVSPLLTTPLIIAAPIPTLGVLCSNIAPYAIIQHLLEDEDAELNIGTDCI